MAFYGVSVACALGFASPLITVLLVFIIHMILQRAGDLYREMDINFIAYTAVLPFNRVFVLAGRLQSSAPNSYAQ